LVPCPNLALSWFELPAHTFRALESCWHAGEGLPYCPATSRGSSGAANDRPGEEYQVRERYQIRANALLAPADAPAPGLSYKEQRGSCRSMPRSICSTRSAQQPGRTASPTLHFHGYAVGFETALCGLVGHLRCHTGRGMALQCRAHTNPHTLMPPSVACTHADILSCGPATCRGDIGVPSDL